MLRIVPYLIMLQNDCWTEKEIEVKELSCIFTLSAFLPHFTVDSVSQWVPPPGFLLTIRRKLRPLTGAILLEGRDFFENCVPKYERWYIDISKMKCCIVRKKLFGTSKAHDSFYFCQHFPMPTQNNQIWVCMYYVYMKSLPVSRAISWKLSKVSCDNRYVLHCACFVAGIPELFQVPWVLQKFTDFLVCAQLAAYGKLFLYTMWASSVFVFSSQACKELGFVHNTFSLLVVALRCIRDPLRFQWL